MIGYIKGQVSHLFSDFCFVDVQGVGYRVFVPNSTRQKLSTGMTVVLFTHLNVREDAMLLYGFITQEEYELFLHLISVTGIGPRVALGILSAANPEGFRLAVSQKNISMLTKIPGIGKKTAERLILELQDKLGAGGQAEPAAGQAVISPMADDVQAQALQALVALGYNQGEIAPIMRKAGSDVKSVEDLIKLALREFGGGR
ncbi:Holliday junction branch migration protein RuvA [Anaerospora sp.]|jgi:Holliday junction DNA helicase RuvA|uniref:Holliday junction branch migration protein RuvA n=1 Tax=Anaerospora sp. TaxID=1960278 RepID=UPI00289BC669|nr:Holliday junction branch migration protein RuvA [Anaerospora sp.]MDF2929277.1 Holliday junction ATP-dependent helicase ruvA [Anaerospora sp.]